MDMEEEDTKRAMAALEDGFKRSLNVVESVSSDPSEFNDTTFAIGALREVGLLIEITGNSAPSLAHCSRTCASSTCSSSLSCSTI